LSVRSDNLDSVGELYTEDNFRQLVVAIEATPAFSAASAGLKIMASAAPIRTSGAVRHLQADE